MKGGYQIIDLKGFNEAEKQATGKATAKVDGIAEVVLNRNEKPLLIQNGRVTTLGGDTFDINGWLLGYIVTNAGVKSFVGMLNDWSIQIVLEGTYKDTFSIQVTPEI